MPWSALEDRGWAIVGMNHYREGGHLNLFVSMAKAGRCIKAEGADPAVVFRELQELAATVERGLAAPPDLNETAALRDLVHGLWLYIGRGVEDQLTTAQIELMYDTVEAEQRRKGDYDGPLKRWWRAQ